MAVWAFISTYIESDVLLLINVKDVALFQRFLRICAHHIGQLVNLTQIANDCGITLKTAESWLLESSYLIKRLQPWYRNFNKRLVKTPKLYFTIRVLHVGSWVYALLSRLAIMLCVVHCLKTSWSVKRIKRFLTKAKFQKYGSGVTAAVMS